MKKNEPINDQDIKNILKEKMDGLSANVDCFDKISARAFPDKSEDFSDSELTVSDLENVTGKRRAVPVLKWVSAAAAAALIIGILPKTAMVNSFKRQLEREKSRKVYRDIISELKEQTESGEYMSFDISLEKYASEDVLVTPLFRCPFKDTGNDDMNVRIFVRMAGSTQTNQVYAVEYSGNYDESNFVAAAKSRASFTESEIAELSEMSSYYSGTPLCMDTASSLINEASAEEASVSAASFCGSMFYKDGDGISEIGYDVFYYHPGSEETGSYSYDVLTLKKSEGLYTKSFELPEEMWKYSVNFDDSSAFPDNSASMFKKEELFKQNYGIPDDVFSIFPLTSSSGKILSDDGRLSIYLADNSSSLLNGNTLLSTLAVPYQDSSRMTTSIYFPVTLDTNSSLNKIVLIAGSSNSEMQQFSYYEDSFLTYSDLLKEMPRLQLIDLQDQLYDILDKNPSEEERESIQEELSQIQAILQQQAENTASSEEEQRRNAEETLKEMQEAEEAQKKLQEVYESQQEQSAAKNK